MFDSLVMAHAVTEKAWAQTKRSESRICSITSARATVASKWREHGTIFSTNSVRSILAGRKCQTRRVIKPQPDLSILRDPATPVEFRRCPTLGPTHTPDEWGLYCSASHPTSVGIYGYRCPYGRPGDRLYVKEIWRPVDHDFAMIGGCEVPMAWRIEYKTDGKTQWATPPEKDRATLAERYGTANTTGGCGDRFRLPRFMPKWAARIWLEITDVRAEMLQDITEADAIAEGVDAPDDEFGGFDRPHRVAFMNLWDSINAKRGWPWDSNPFVWVLTFRRTSP